MFLGNFKKIMLSYDKKINIFLFFEINFIIYRVRLARNNDKFKKIWLNNQFLKIYGYYERVVWL